MMALGYIAAFSETLALTVIASEGLPPLLNAFTTEVEDHIRSASAWSLGQIGRHSPNHAKAVAELEVLPPLVGGFVSKHSSEDLQSKCKKAVKGICDRLTFFPALNSLLQVSVTFTSTSTSLMLFFHLHPCHATGCTSPAAKCFQ